jgi:hypothetical protein
LTHGSQPEFGLAKYLCGSFALMPHRYVLRVTRWAELRFAASVTNGWLTLASGKLGPLALLTEP